MRNFKSGVIVKHFKRELISKEELISNPTKYLYEIVGTAKNTETGEKMMIYKPLYKTDCINDVNFAARPLEMFLSEVDKVKYPNIKQKYRFEEFNEGEE